MRQDSAADKPPHVQEMAQAFRRATRNARALFGSLDSFVVLRHAGRDWHAPDPGGLPDIDPAASVVLATDAPLWIEDCYADPRFEAEGRALNIQFYAAAPIRLADGRACGVLCVAGRDPRPHDVRLLSLLTDLADGVAEAYDRVFAVAAERAHTALAEASVEVLNALVQTLPLGIVMTDRDMRILKASPTWARAFKRTDADLVGVTLYDVAPYFGGFRDLHKRVLSGETLSYPRLAFETGARTEYLNTRLAPWRRPDGEIGGLIVTSYNVTDLVEAMERVERSERRLQIAVQLADLHVWEVDYVKRCIEKVGEDTFFETPIEFEDIAEDFHSPIHPEDRHLAIASYELRKAGNSHDRLVCRANRSDGKDVWMSSAAEVVRDENGDIARVVGVFQNITRAKEAEKALIAARDEADAANRAKSEFLANMSHEIRTPLNGVLGMAQVIEAGDLSDEQRERVRVIRESGTTLLAILNDVLDLSKIQAGKFELSPAPFDMSDLVRVVGAAFDGAASAKDVTLSANIDPSCDGAWMGDGLRLRQVLSNLVSNALKFTEQGAVEISAWAGEGEIILAVRDSGIGIKAEHIPRLFEKFTQADASTTRRFGGTGLGLSISHELITLMGGRIEVESREGEGSCFTLHVPLERTRSAPAALAPAPQTQAQDRRLNILAAEDNPTNQLVLRSLLAPLDIDLTIVGDGQAAVEAFGAGAFDIILMDVQMPRMNGVEATAAIRRLEAQSGRARTPILALSANVMAHQVAEYRQVGMDGCVAKPIEIDKLFAALDTALSPVEDELAQTG